MQAQAQAPLRSTMQSLKTVTGFSLIELMVVILILAFAASGIRTVFDPSGSLSKQMNEQGEAIYAQMQYALDEALFTLNPLGLVIDQDAETGLLATAYKWYAHNGDSWVEREKPLTGGELKDNFTWEIFIEDEPLEESLDDLLEQDEETLKPQIAFYPSGEVTPFEIEISPTEAFLLENPDANGLRYKIAVNERGAVVRFLAGEEGI